MRRCARRSSRATPAEGEQNGLITTQRYALVAFLEEKPQAMPDTFIADGPTT
ncbi:hypothetical protein [Aminobacter sp. HY435]|uniref:hypothetical protein n=1 Tax=Aminobacter sp. HY435 TaxID=2970917 RepID=UPI0022B957F5|nr:hypothetical protein [Aminobacter sp. HY435]